MGGILSARFLAVVLVAALAFVSDFFLVLVLRPRPSSSMSLPLAKDKAEERGRRGVGLVARGTVLAVVRLFRVAVF